MTCRRCGTDITRTCHAFMMRGPRGVELVQVIPMLCPECSGAMFTLGTRPRILRPPS